MANSIMLNSLRPDDLVCCVSRWHFVVSVCGYDADLVVGWLTTTGLTLDTSSYHASFTPEQIIRAKATSA